LIYIKKCGLFFRVNDLIVDLVVKNCKLVYSGGIIEGGVAVDDGIIVAIANSPNLPDADMIIDAKGKVVLPGVIDSHVHTDRLPEDSRTGTKAAAHGGITTILDMHGVENGVFARSMYEKKRLRYEETSYVDFSMHAGCASSYPYGTLTNIWKQGSTGIKFFISSAGPKWPQTRDGEIIERFKELAKINGLALIHAENDQILRDNYKRLEKAGRRDYNAHLEWRPPLAEAECGQRIIRYLKETGCRGLIVHTSLPETVVNAWKAKQEGVKVYVETCPQYLYLSDDDVNKRGPWVKFAPPPRNKEAVAELWKMLEAGWVDTVATDHAPLSKESKEAGLEDMMAAPNGIPGLETFLPLLLTGVNNGRLSLERLAAVTSENPARIYGIHPRKGALLPGSDGDLTIVDMKKKWKIRNEDLITACGWTPYEGFEAEGVPIHALVRGTPILEDGVVVSHEGFGTFISRLQ
jgi:dihydroorotase (multifunctional complex type)